MNLRGLRALIRRTACRGPALNLHIILLTLFGLLTLLAAWLPLVLRRLPLSLPIVSVALGVGMGLSFLSPVLKDNPLENLTATRWLTEFVVLVSLMGAGLKIDRRMGLRRWALAWRLIGIAMPLTIAGIAGLGWAVLGLSPAAALLLGAALAPTDPVLASDIQVGPPREGREDDVRFALTAEAGLNDGLSLPFVYLALALAAAGNAPLQASLTHWFLVDVLWRLGAGVAIGWFCGRVLGHLMFRLPESTRIARSGEGFVALGATCLGYGLTELAHGYGFLAVFVTALTIRATERDHDYHIELHAFTEQIERLVMVLVLVYLGAAIAEGTVFGALSPAIIGVALLVLLVVRPAAALVSLAGTGTGGVERLAIAFFGIRGLGSFYYLAFALGLGAFDQPRVLWVTVSLVVVLSIVMHGVAVTPAMGHLDRLGRRARRRFRRDGRA